MAEQTFDRLIVQLMAKSTADKLPTSDVYKLVSDISASVQAERASSLERIKTLETHIKKLEETVKGFETESKTVLIPQTQSPDHLKAKPGKKKKKRASGRNEAHEYQSTNGTLNCDNGPLHWTIENLGSEPVRGNLRSMSIAPSSHRGQGLPVSDSAAEDAASRLVANRGPPQISALSLIANCPFSGGVEMDLATAGDLELCSTSKPSTNEEQGKPIVNLGGRLNARRVLATGHRMSSSSLSTVDSSRDPRLVSKVPTEIEHAVISAGSKRSLSEHTEWGPAKKNKFDDSTTMQNPTRTGSFDSKSVLRERLLQRMREHSV